MGHGPRVLEEPERKAWRAEPWVGERSAGTKQGWLWGGAGRTLMAADRLYQPAQKQGYCLGEPEGQGGCEAEATRRETGWQASCCRGVPLLLWCGKSGGPSTAS